ncbi:MAG: hypothetical protein ABW215_23760, partial [Kibdelosporangium sp.]
MAVGLSYADAVRLLDAGDSRLVAALDRLTGGVLLAAAATGAGFVFSLFDPKAELARLSMQLVNGLRDRLRGSRAERSDRLAAAHAVLVLAAYFETLQQVELPFRVDLSAQDQLLAATGHKDFLHAVVPSHGPQWAYETTLDTLGSYYEGLSADVLAYMSGLAVWDGVDETRRARFEDIVRTHVPPLALARYEELFRRFAGEFPEVAFWANLTEHQGNRAAIRQLTSGLAGLEAVLAGIATGRAPDERRQALARAYQAALREPILQPVAGLVHPPLADAYVNPAFRACPADDHIAEESWWRDQDIRADLQGFLIGHLTAPQAATAPLVVLGQPGSGKSVLTKVIAARLPPSEFLTVRVVLRDVPADSEPQHQIERAILAATGESLTW